MTLLRQFVVAVLVVSAPMGIAASQTLATGGGDPVAGSQDLITAADYPFSALLRHREGTTYYTLTVDTKGRVKDCAITQSSGTAELDRATCRALKRRAHFKPAMDANGNPIESSFSASVNWRDPSRYNGLALPF